MAKSKGIGSIIGAIVGKKVEEAVEGKKSAPLSLESRVTEIEGDLVRIVGLLVKGDLDAAKFKEILAKRQGKA